MRNAEKIWLSVSTQGKALGKLGMKLKEDELNDHLSCQIVQPIFAIISMKSGFEL